MGNKQSRTFKDTRLGRMWLLKFLFVSIPSIPRSEPRWATLQVILSLVFFFVAIAIGSATINPSKIGGGAMTAVWISLGLAFLCLSYAVGLGIHWVKADSRKYKGETGGGDELHNDIQGLIQRMTDLVEEMRQDRNERTKNSK